MGGADSISVEKWSLIKEDMGFQVIPYQNAGAAWYQSLMLKAMDQASGVMVLSIGYDVTYNCFFQEQMKNLHQSNVYESTFKPNVIMRT